MVLDHFGQFVLGVIAIAVAAALLAVAVIERPSPARMPRALVATAAVWALAFSGAAVYALVRFEQFAIFGLFVAASELLAAAAIWTGRSRRRRPPGDGGGWGENEDPPEPPDVPKEWWARWEESLRDHRAGSGSRRRGG